MEVEETQFVLDVIGTMRQREGNRARQSHSLNVQGVHERPGLWHPLASLLGHFLCVVFVGESATCGASRPHFHVFHIKAL